MPTPKTRVIRSSRPNPSAELQTKYGNTPLVGTAGAPGRFLGRIIIEVWDQRPGSPNGAGMAFAWYPTHDVDPGPIFQNVAAELARSAVNASEMYKQHASPGK